MLDVSSPGGGQRFCDGMARRSFLRIGALGVGGLALPQLLRLQAEGTGGPKRRCRALIMVMMSGGASHIDTYDMKPDAPRDYRGEFRPISTRIPGVSFCEHLPLHAGIADKLAVVRSLRMGFNDHQNQCEILSGFPARVIGGKPAAPNRPVFGSIISRLGPASNGQLPRYVSLSEEDPDRFKQQDPAYAGMAHRPFVPAGEGLKDLSLAAGISFDGLRDRKSLLKSFDTLRRDLDAQRDMDGIDAFTAKALEMISSNAVRDAFDVTREPDRVRALYGSQALDKLAEKTTGGYRWDHKKFILARRLAEAGGPAITIFLSGWDHHGRIEGEKLGVFEKLQGMLPAFDRYLYGLVTDLHERRLDQEVAVLAWGEFGRSPRVDQHVGRDHWPAANFALLAGGGMRMGQVIGSTDGKAENIKQRPLTPQNVFATVYRLLGIDPAQTLPDHNGRPMYLLEDSEPIAELI
jgi:uncharacterized protein (DUF1501 family)